MKTIVLLPAKNEAWILRSSLKNFSSFADYIMIADQQSTDGSLDIYNEFSKVKVIQNTNTNHNNTVRWLLLNEARKIEGQNLIICLDADEMISPKYIEDIKSKAEKLLINKPEKTFGFSLPWIQLWKSTTTHRIDSVWRNNMKPTIFIDDRNLEYSKEIALNDHTSRIPNVSEIIEMKDYPILHFQYVAWNQSQLKQAWYRCNELISGKNSARYINHKYSSSLDGSFVETEPILNEWIDGVPLEYVTTPIESDWRYTDILNWFKKYGIEFFEPLEIWRLDPLYNMFLKIKGHKPKVKKYTPSLLKLNNLKNYLKRLFR